MHIFIVDDHQLFRSGLVLLLSSLHKDIVFEEANTFSQLMDYQDKDSIDLILLDYYLPDADGIESLQTIKQEFNCSVVVLSSEDNPKVIREVIAQGASGFVPKSSSPEVLVAAIKLVLANGVYLPPHVLDDFNVNRNIDDTHREKIMTKLSKKQLAVLTGASQGKSNKVIARELHIAEGTVKAHLSACYRALEVDNRTEAVYAAYSMGLLSESTGAHPAP